MNPESCFIYFHKFKNYLYLFFSTEKQHKNNHHPTCEAPVGTEFRDQQSHGHTDVAQHQGHPSDEPRRHGITSRQVMGIHRFFFQGNSGAWCIVSGYRNWLRTPNIISLCLEVYMTYYANGKHPSNQRFSQIGILNQLGN